MPNIKYLPDKNFSIRSGGHCFSDWSSTTGTLILLNRLLFISMSNDNLTYTPNYINNYTKTNTFKIHQGQAETNISKIQQEQTGTKTNNNTSGLVQEQETIWVGTGWTLGPLQEKLIKSGRMISCGTRPTVGLGGQALSGGIGYSTRKFGLLIEDILAYEIILANKEIIIASEDSYPDLFWALRGNGSGNFGIVSRFLIRTHPIPKEVTVFTYHYPHNREIIQWITDPKRINMNRNLTCQLVIDRDGIKFTGQSLDGDLSELPILPIELKKKVTDQSIDNCLPKPINEVNEFLGPIPIPIEKEINDEFLGPIPIEKEVTDEFPRPIPIPIKKEVKTLSMLEAFHYFTAPTVQEYVDGKSSFGMFQLSNDAIDILFEGVKKIKGRFTIGIQMLAGKTFSKISFISPNSPYWINYTLRWNIQDEKNSLDDLQKLYMDMKDHLTPYAYQGYSDKLLTNWKEGYYGNNYSRLLKIKKKYDPDNIFTHSQGISS